MKREPKPITEDEVRAAYEKEMFKDDHVFDPCALTVQQVANRNQTSVNTARLYAQAKVREGLWEQVWGRDPLGRAIKAYRPKK